MKKLLVIAVVLALALGLTAGAALARTTMWTEIDNIGTIEYREITSVAGWDWSEGLGTVYADPGCGSPWVDSPSWEVTAVLDESVRNEGYLYLRKCETSDAQWDLEHYKYMTGDGHTEIFKFVDAWTEDSRVCPSTGDGVDPYTGRLCWPTEVWVESDYYTTTYQDVDGAHVVLDIPSAQDDTVPQYGNHLFFTKIYVHDSEPGDEFYSYEEKVGINDFPSDYECPCPPKPPEPHLIHNYDS